MGVRLQMIFAVRKDGRRKHFRRQHDKKVNVLALVAVIGAPDEILVPELQAAMGQFAAASVKLLTDLKRQQVCFARYHSMETPHSIDHRVYRSVGRSREGK